MNAIEIKNVSKQYGAVKALDDVSVSFEAGKIYGLLGRNGAGKTTLLNIITGRIFADGGTVSLDGVPTSENDAALGRVYMLSEQTYYPQHMKVRDAFKWTGEFYKNFDAAYADKLAGSFGLNTKHPVKALSTGYGTIFKLIIALSCNAPYVLLDEPVLGLDANHRDLFYKTLLEHYAESPSCYIVSTHLVEEVSGLVEDVIIIKEGKIIVNEPRDNLLARGYTVSGTAALVDGYTAGKTVLGVDVIGGLKSACILGEKDNVPAGLETGRIDLQRLFIQLTN